MLVHPNCYAGYYVKCNCAQVSNKVLGIHKALISKTAFISERPALGVRFLSSLKGLSLHNQYKHLGLNTDRR